MRVQDMITTAGGLRPNEDRAGHCGSLAWVIDGATDLHDDAALPAERDLHWLVDFVAEHLAGAGARSYRDVERSAAGDTHARFKRSDDVAAILLSPEVP